MKKDYDIIIVGGGPAGLSAAVYSERYGLSTLLISKTRGGLAATANLVCNFPTYVSIKGYELMQKFISQVENLGVTIIFNEITKIEKIKENFYVKSANETYKCKKIIFAAGTERLRLNVPGEAKLFGRGISYCATCDVPFFKNKIVSVNGGGDAALTAALQLADVAKEVYLIHRRNEFRAEAAWINAVNKEKKIKQLLSEEITEILGDKKVEGIKLKSGKILNLDGVFIEIGSKPEIEFISNLEIETNERGYIKTDNLQKTNISGFFAAGDVTEFPLKQITTAVSQGSVAAYAAYCEIKKEGLC